MNGYQIVSESIGKKFYHGSPIQNLKTLDLKKDSVRFKTQSPSVFITDDKGYASCFTFAWSNNEGFELGSINNGPWTIEIPKKFKSRLSKPCSIYIVESGPYKQIKSMPAEYVSKKSIKVIKEIKYKTALEAMKSNGVKIVV
jgi:hypothetical protein